MKSSVIRVEMENNLIETLEKELKKRKIKDGIIASVVGALKEFTIITIYKDSKKKPPDHFPKTFKIPVELSGNGFISGGKVHIHASMGAENGKTYNGHLVEGTVTYFVDIGIIYS